MPYISKATGIRRATQTIAGAVQIAGSFAQKLYETEATTQINAGQVEVDRLYEQYANDFDVDLFGDPTKPIDQNSPKRVVGDISEYQQKANEWVASSLSDLSKTYTNKKAQQAIIAYANAKALKLSTYIDTKYETYKIGESQAKSFETADAITKTYSPREAKARIDAHFDSLTEGVGNAPLFDAVTAYKNKQEYYKLIYARDTEALKLYATDIEDSVTKGADVEEALNLYSARLDQSIALGSVNSGDKGLLMDTARKAFKINSVVGLAYNAMFDENGRLDDDALGKAYAVIQKSPLADKGPAREELLKRFTSEKNAQNAQDAVHDTLLVDKANDIITVQALAGKDPSEGLALLDSLQEALTNPDNAEFQGTVWKFANPANRTRAISAIMAAQTSLKAKKQDMLIEDAKVSESGKKETVGFLAGAFEYYRGGPDKPANYQQLVNLSKVTRDILTSGEWNNSPTRASLEAVRNSIVTEIAAIDTAEANRQKAMLKAAEDAAAEAEKTKTAEAKRAKEQAEAKAAAKENNLGVLISKNLQKPMLTYVSTGNIQHARAARDSGIVMLNAVNQAVENGEMDEETAGQLRTDIDKYVGQATTAIEKYDKEQAEKTKLAEEKAKQAAKDAAAQAKDKAETDSANTVDSIFVSINKQVSGRVDEARLLEEGSPEWVSTIQLAIGSALYLQDHIDEKTDVIMSPAEAETLRVKARAAMNDAFKLWDSYQEKQKAAGVEITEEAQQTNYFGMERKLMAWEEAKAAYLVDQNGEKLAEAYTQYVIPIFNDLETKDITESNYKIINGKLISAMVDRAKVDIAYRTQNQLAIGKGYGDYIDQYVQVVQHYVALGSPADMKEEYTAAMRMLRSAQLELPEIYSTDTTVSLLSKTDHDTIKKSIDSTIISALEAEKKLSDEYKEASESYTKQAYKQDFLTLYSAYSTNKALPLSIAGFKSGPVSQDALIAWVNNNAKNFDDPKALIDSIAGKMPDFYYTAKDALDKFLNSKDIVDKLGAEWMATASSAQLALIEKCQGATDKDAIEGYLKTVYDGIKGKAPKFTLVLEGPGNTFNTDGKKGMYALIDGRLSPEFGNNQATIDALLTVNVKYLGAYLGISTTDIENVLLNPNGPDGTANTADDVYGTLKNTLHVSLPNNGTKKIEGAPMFQHGGRYYTVISEFDKNGNATGALRAAEVISKGGALYAVPFVNQKKASELVAGKTKEEGKIQAAINNFSTGTPNYLIDNKNATDTKNIADDYKALGVAYMDYFKSKSDEDRTTYDTLVDKFINNHVGILLRKRFRSDLEKSLTSLTKQVNDYQSALDERGYKAE